MIDSGPDILRAFFMWAIAVTQVSITPRREQRIQGRRRFAFQVQQLNFAKAKIFTYSSSSNLLKSWYSVSLFGGVITMRNLLGCLTVFLLFVSGSAVTAWANDLDVSLTTDCSSNGICFLSLGQGPGAPASGNATFSGTPWSYQFVTAEPSSWNLTFQEYTAVFGPGGTFFMTGPDNLLFTGQITSGSAYQYFDYTYAFGIDLNFTGMWSNDVQASGEVTLSGIINTVTYGTLDTYTVPEPTSLALLGSGVVGMSGVFRRRINA